jgi:hypothetical protein
LASLAKILVLISSGIVVLALDLSIIDFRERGRGDDFFPFWGAGRAIQIRQREV